MPCTLEMLHIDGCQRLRSFVGLSELTKLDDLMIARCPLLQFSIDEHISSAPSYVEITACPRLVNWCQEHGIDYERVSADKTQKTNTLTEISYFLISYTLLCKQT